MLDVRHHDARVHFLDARVLRQLLEEELLIGLDVLGHEPEQEVDVAEQDVAIEHLGVLADGVGERGQVAAAMGGQLDVREDHGVEADLLAIEFHGLVANDALVAEPLDAPPARRL